jgi:diguanylate cyclase (GGDEF)-like protein
MPTLRDLHDVIELHGDIAEQGLDLAGVMQLVVQRAMGLVGADGAALELAEGEHMVYQAVSGIAASQLGIRLPLAQSLSATCLRETQALLCMDTEQDERVNREVCRRVGLRSMVVVPLLHQGQGVGVLKAMSLRPGAFQPRHAELLRLLSRVVGTSMYWATRYGHDDLFYRATHDELTGLANRSLFMDRLRHAIRQAQRQSQGLALVVLDMDGLKGINDVHGHQTGDAALVEFARRLRETARSSDTVARLGGDEFAIVLQPVADQSEVQQLSRRLQQALSRPHQLGTQQHNIAGSCGCALYPEDGLTLDALLDCADRRMYAVKRQRKAAARSGL